MMTQEERSQICRVVVHQARHLIAKGVDGTWSSAFVKMSCDKERFITSVSEKSPNPQWNEDCEFAITKADACVEMVVYHRGKLLDDFLGMVTLPVGKLLGSHAAITNWYKLQHRPGKTKKDSKDRGEIEITMEAIENSLTQELDCDEGLGQNGSSKAKKPSSLRAKTPGLKSKFKVPRLKSYTAVSKDDSTLPEFIRGREKSDSNDSGRASDSIASESPASERRLSHNAQGNFGSQESVSSVGSHTKTKKGGLRKRMKSAIGTLKRDKTHRKDPSSHSPYGSASSLPSAALDAHPHTHRDTHPDTPPSPSSSPSSPSHWAAQGNVIHRNRTASTSELYTGSAPKAARPLSYPLRAISEEYIPLEVLYSKRHLQREEGGACQELGGSGMQEQNDEVYNEQNASRDGKLRHSFRSGLPSLRKSNVSVTFDPTTESGYGTGAREEEHEEKLPAQYVKMTKEGLIHRLLLKERLLRERQHYIRQLEDYTDNLLLKVMLESPRLLDRDFHPRAIRR